ncbi:unnamed protein product [Sphacelaria rigidula]
MLAWLSSLLLLLLAASQRVATSSSLASSVAALHVMRTAEGRVDDEYSLHDYVLHTVQHSKFVAQCGSVHAACRHQQHRSAVQAAVHSSKSGGDTSVLHTRDDDLLIP